MNPQELSIVAFLVEALASAPSYERYQEFFKKIPQQGSEFFLEALKEINELSKLISKNKKLKIEKLTKAIEELKKNPNSEVAHSIYEVFAWTLNHQQEKLRLQKTT